MCDKDCIPHHRKASKTSRSILRRLILNHGKQPFNLNQLLPSEVVLEQSETGLQLRRL